MSAPSELEEIRRIAYEIWQAEGEPAGRDREHWERARRIYESRAAGSEHAPQPMNPGFEDAEPGKVPDMKDDPAPELPDPPMGRFAKQLHDLPEEKGCPPPRLRAGARAAARAPGRTRGRGRPARG